MFKIRKIIKKTIVMSIVLIMLVTLFGCEKNKETKKDNELNIVTTLFPYYDFTRAVVGNVKNVNVSMVVSPGQDSHSFEPTPKDIIKINDADILIYNGGSIETWMETVLKAEKNKNQIQKKMMDYVSVLNEEHVEGMDTRFEEEEEPGEVEEDEHIWTSPVNAQILVEKICEALCEKSPENSKAFRQNASKYINKLKRLDSQFKSIVNNSETKEIIFADKFPLQYFAKEYGLKYYAAFPGCGSDMEPSVKTIAFLIDKIKEDNIKAVFYLELSSQGVANAICDDTKTIKLQFNSCHNITEKQFESGVTYYDLMEDNVTNLKKALGE